MNDRETAASRLEGYDLGVPEPRVKVAAIPDGIVSDVPGLAEALSAYDTAYRSYQDAVDTYEDYGAECGRLRVVRQRAIEEASAAVAAGKSRPEIPSAPGEAEEEQESAVLVGVARLRAGEVDQAARRVNALVDEHVDLITATLAEAYPALLDEADKSLRYFENALIHVKSLRGQVISLRTSAEARTRGTPLTSPAVKPIAVAFTEPASTRRLEQFEARQVDTIALGDLRGMLTELRNVAESLTGEPDPDRLRR